MRLATNRDAEEEDGWSGRRRRHRSDSHDWMDEDDVAPYSLARRPRREEVQRPLDRPPPPPPPRSLYGRSSRSIDASQPMMPPPLPLPASRSSTVAYRRPRQALAYEDEDEEDSDDWRRRPRRERRDRRNTSPEYDRPRRPIYHAPSPGSHSSSEDDDDEDDDLGESEIEVVEYDADDRRHRRRRPPQAPLPLPSRDDYMESSEERRPRRRRVNRRRSLDEDEIEVEVNHSSPERDSSYHRSPARHDPIDSPRKGRTQRVSSIIENSRPPVASQRVAKVYESKEIIRESRPRRSSTVQIVRKSRSSSRRPPSMMDSIFGGSSRGPSPEPRPPPKRYECLVCCEDYPSSKIAKLKCGHRRCHPCLKRQFKISITDPSQMPPKCCTSEPIPLKHVERLFDDTFKRGWNRKFAEFSTRNRVYCSGKRCGEWIKPSNIQYEGGRKVARCSRCNTKTCGACHGRMHASRECPRDEDTLRFLDQAKEEGWKQCYRCKAMIELKDGCNHITCRCGAEFCIICGQKWKSCDCPWFNYDSMDTDPLDDMDVPIPPIRGDIGDAYQTSRPPSPGDIRPQPRSAMIGPAPRPSSYEEEVHMRQLQHQRKSERRRRSYGERDGPYGHMGGVGDVMGVGTSASHYMNEKYRRGSHPFSSPPPAGPAAYERPHAGGAGGDYLVGVSKARGVRGGSMERRLADRFSEHRGATGTRSEIGPPMAPPLSPHMGSPVMPGLPPPMGMPPQIGPPPIGPHMPDDGMMYTLSGMRSSPRRVIVEEEHDYNDDDDDDELYNDRRGGGGRRRRVQRREEPKSSTLAGLSGQGQGMGRVGGWLNYVEPGDPEESGAAMASA